MAEKYIPKVGDRVRVTGLEGVVKFRNSNGLDIELEDAVGDKKLAYLPAAAIPSIEKLGPKLPTVPGSVIRWKDRPLVLDDNGQWGSYEYAPVTRTILADGFEVLHDAGAVK